MIESLHPQPTTQPPSAQASAPLCVCLQYVGDNGDCAIHGKAPIIWTQQAEDAAWARLRETEAAWNRAEDPTERSTAFVECAVATSELLKIRKAYRGQS
jgi:hypothetical protein